jgi:hypothetical protein
LGDGFCHASGAWVAVIAWAKALFTLGASLSASLVNQPVKQIKKPPKGWQVLLGGEGRRLYRVNNQLIFKELFVFYTYV